MARGPRHPFIDLPRAVEMIDRMKNYTGRPGRAPAMSVIEEAWGYTSKSSSGTKTVAALRYFGLIEDDIQDKLGKSIKLTQRALHILLAHEGSDEKKQALKDAALSPDLYLYCWKEWGCNFPPSMRTTLLLKKGFAEKSVDSFIRDYRKTIEYAGLSNNNTALSKTVDNGDVSEDGHDDSEKLEYSSYDSEIGSIQESIVEKKNIYNQQQQGKSKKIPMRQAIWPLDEGEAKFQWPAEMSHVSLTRLEAWIELIKSDIKNSARATSSPPAEDTDSE